MHELAALLKIDVITSEIVPVRIQASGDWQVQGFRT